MPSTFAALCAPKVDSKLRAGRDRRDRDWRWPIESLLDDRLRQEDLKLAGIEMTRVTDVRFHREPGAVLERVATLLANRRRERGRSG